MHRLHCSLSEHSSTFSFPGCSSSAFKVQLRHLFQQLPYNAKNGDKEGVLASNFVHAFLLMGIHWNDLFLSPFPIWIWGFLKKNKDCILFITKPQTFGERPGHLHSVCQSESLVVSLEHFYNDIHLLACEWWSTLITGQTGALKCQANMDKLAIVNILHAMNIPLFQKSFQHLFCSLHCSRYYAPAPKGLFPRGTKLKISAARKVTALRFQWRDRL